MKYFGFLLISTLLSMSCLANTLDYAQVYTTDSVHFDAPKTYYVKLPASYDTSPGKRYPTLYLLHGQWDMLPAAATIELLGQEIPQFIIVGVKVSGKALRQPPNKNTGNNDNKTPFFKFLHNELVPKINQTYRSAPFKILSGHSNSGKFVTNTWLTHPNYFSAYFAFSPSLDDGKVNKRVEHVSKIQLKQASPLFVTIASEGDHMQQPFDQLITQLSPILTIRLSHKKFPLESHGSTRHASLSFALRTLFKGWQPSYDVKIGGMSGLEQHYTGLNKRFGLNETIPDELLQKLCGFYAMSDDKDAQRNLKQVIDYAVGINANNVVLFDEIIDYFNSNNDATSASKITKLICKKTSTADYCND